MNKINCLVVGAGYMTDEYLKVLKFKNIQTSVVGRSKENVSKIQKKYNIEAYCGGIEAFQFKIEYTHAIVAASIQNLFVVTCFLIKNGVKNILVEKPACLTKSELKIIYDLTVSYNTTLFIAYNRRFYSSIDTLKNLTIEEGGIENINFYRPQESMRQQHNVAPLQQGLMQCSLYAMTPSHLTQMIWILSLYLIMFPSYCLYTDRQQLDVSPK
jgi:predicted dehydrogenase